MLNYNLYVRQIIEMILLLKRSNLERLESDRLMFDATMMRLQVIGESTNKIPLKMRKKYAFIPWGSLIRTRDFVSHNYEWVNPVVMREFILTKVIPLENALKKILKEENKDE